ncbi:MAG: group 1 truncated hemoglobin [Proteobacteria bacterium]|nr:group 1 truncated hemoglobin [Pseudomonadota bacterium]
MPQTVNRVALILAGALLASLANAAPAHAVLYDRLGGHDGVTAIATQLIDRVASDPALGRSFEGTNRRQIAAHLAEQLCELSGGPCRYSGDPMRVVHAGHAIGEREFYGMVEALEQILKARGVALADRNHLLRLLAPMKRDVVNVPAEGP